MKKETKSQIKSDVISGMSSSLGAAVGVVTGNVITAEANAATQTPEPEPQSTPMVNPEPVAPEVDVQVIESGRVTNYDGTQMDVAVISIEGQQAVAVDGNLDGTVDVIAIDINGNNIVDNGEIIDVTGEGISMQPFQQGTMQPQPTLLAQEQDYVNNADVHEFIS